MRTPNKKILADALEFAARWGFLTQQIFFEFICQMSQAQQYRYWNYLVTSGLFLKSRHSSSTLILAKKGRADFGDMARPSRSHFYVEHDAIVARFFLALEKRGLVINSWLEDELMRNPIETYDVLGLPQIQRVPDLVFDLKTTNNSSIRCALEIERVTKSQSRYSKVALAYLNASKIDVVLFGCIQPTTERVIRRAFSTPEHMESKRVPGTFLFDEFDPVTLLTNIKFQDNTMSVQRFIEVVTKQTVPKMINSGENHENAFSRQSDEKNGGCIMKFQNKINEIASTQARPPKSLIFPDHPHPTMLVEGGQEPGDGPGWRVGKQNKSIGESERYKTKQREFYQVDSMNWSLWIDYLKLIDGSRIAQRLVLGLPDRILCAPNDGCGHSGFTQRGWDHTLGDPSVLDRAYARYSSSRLNLNLKPEEVEI